MWTLKKFIVYSLCSLLLVPCAKSKHYILYTRPSHEISFMDSYYYSQNLCSVDFVNPSMSIPTLRNVTNTKNNTSNL